MLRIESGHCRGIEMLGKERTYRDLTQFNPLNTVMLIRQPNQIFTLTTQRDEHFFTAFRGKIRPKADQ
ncbi:Uncharacterised protein [Vibrio cholerae]|nr:Uncharacterised protein [Vibrio cholerae]CSB53714.1 Uncharacterised protein [Vibrio cholerae]CSB60075.1 Uncharacterised protein [Vibrio cholerae]CSB61948.1 Uncharacterised protein [Vibrio cholerae]CSC68165.1 Uncharacterised protein [Vibrio cholerae]